MPFIYLSIPIFIAAIDWAAVATGWKKVEYIAKPGVMAALFVWLWAFGRLEGNLFWIGLALFASLAGDIFLMLPNEQFVAGLSSFLIAHVAYLIALNASPPPINAASLLIVLIAGIAALQVFRRIFNGLDRSGQTRLKIPVLIYAGAISLMLISALATLVRTEWDPFAAILVSAGALLFFTSDTLLAWNRFVGVLTNARFKVIATYHLGQIGLVAGAVLQALVSQT